MMTARGFILFSMKGPRVERKCCFYIYVVVDLSRVHLKRKPRSARYASHLSFIWIFRIRKFRWLALDDAFSAKPSDIHSLLCGTFILCNMITMSPHYYHYLYGMLFLCNAGIIVIIKSNVAEVVLL